jgi:hypothetical protein
VFLVRAGGIIVGEGGGEQENRRVEGEGRKRISELKLEI